MEDKPNVVHMKAKDEVQASLEMMRRELPKLIEHAALVAQVKRAYFIALVKEGFTEVQALELCKHPVA